MNSERCGIAKHDERRTDGRRRTQFTIKSTLVVMLGLALVLGWFVDHKLSRSRFRAQLRHETEQRATAESQFSSFAHWYATEYSLDEVPDHHRDLVRASTQLFAASLDPADGFQLLRLRNARTTLAHVGLQGDGFRVRGGAFRYELIGEDLSAEELSIVFRLIGPKNVSASQNTDGVPIGPDPKSWQC